MNSKQRKILAAIFEKPTRKNILWQDIEKLLMSLGAEIANQGGSVVTIKMCDLTQTFHRPHPAKEAKAYCVQKIRDFLTENGITP